MTQKEKVYKPKCLAIGMYIHMDRKSFKKKNLRKGDYYVDVDFGTWEWNGKKFIYSQQ